MKKIILFLAIVISFSAVSQNVGRIEVSGKIIVEGSDISGITIFNTAIILLALAKLFMPQKLITV